MTWMLGIFGRKKAYFSSKLSEHWKKMKFSAPENNFQNSFRDDVAPTENIQNRQNSTKSKGGSTQKWWNESPFGDKCGVNSCFLAFFRLLTKCGANSKKSLKFRLILKKMKFSAPENNFQNSFKNDVAPTENIQKFHFFQNYSKFQTFFGIYPTFFQKSKKS